MPRKDYIWMDDAKCLTAPPEWFFSLNRDNLRKGQEVCSSCSVRESCMKWGFATLDRFPNMTDTEFLRSVGMHSMRTGEQLKEARSFMSDESLIENLKQKL